MTKETATTATAVKKYENISEQVLAKIEAFQQDGGLVLPKGYAVENTMKSAWLVLQATTDKNGKPALSVCTKESIANSLLDMVLQGLSVSKKQGYFIVYGNELQFQRSYFGTVALAKRTGGITDDPVANVVYEGDEFEYEIDPMSGRTKITKHKQQLANIDNTKIIGAYAITLLSDGTRQATIMSMAQIRAAWGMGATKGASPAHRNFAEEMAKKSVINRACKMAIGSSSDAWLYDGMRDEADGDRAEARREAAKAAIQTIEDAEVEEVVAEKEIPTEQAKAPELFANESADAPY